MLKRFSPELHFNRNNPMTHVCNDQFCMMLQFVALAVILSLKV